MFWRNEQISAWCTNETTIITKEDREYGSYSDYWIGIYDNDDVKVNLSSFGGMCGYKFENFFDPKDIENEMDLLIQEKLLSKINNLIDLCILKQV